MADSLPLLVWISGPHKRRTYFNKAWLDFTGRPLEFETGDAWADDVHPDDRQQCLDTYTCAFDRRETFMREYRLRRHDGDYRWLVDNAAPLFDPDGSFAGYLGACVDVTELRRAEAELNFANDRLRLAMRELGEAQRLAGVGSWQWNRDTDTVVWSEELYRIAGRDPSLPAVSYKDTHSSYARELGPATARRRHRPPHRRILRTCSGDGPP
jgi:PAS domain S-box-containing protein